MLSRAPQADAIEPSDLADAGDDQQRQRGTGQARAGRASSSGSVIATTPTSRARERDPGERDERGRASRMDTRPTPKIRAAPIASSALFRASPGRTGGCATSPRGDRRSVEGVGDEARVACRDVGAGAVE